MSVFVRFKSYLLTALAAAALAAAGCTNPETAKVEHVKRGEQYLQQRQYQKAALEFRGAIQIDERYADAYWGLVRAYEGEQMTEEAFNALRRLVVVNPNHLDALAKMGNYALVVGRLPAAESMVQEILQKNPDHIEGRILLASLHFVKNRPAEALAELNRAAEIDPAHGKTHVYLADYYARVKEPVRAEESLRRAISADERASFARIAYGNFLYQQGRPGEAEEQFRKAVEADPDDRNTHLTLGGFYIGTGQLEKAEATYRSFADGAGQDRPEAKSALAIFYANTNRRDESLRILRGVIEKWPQYELAKIQLAEVLVQGHDVDGALSQLRSVLEKNPADQKAILMRLQINMATRKYAEAAEDARAVLKKQPRSPLALYALAEASYRLGKLDEAEAGAGSFLMYYPDYLPAKVMQAQIQVAMKSPKPALQNVGEVLQRLPEAGKLGFSESQATDLKAKALTLRGYARAQLEDPKGALGDMKAALQLAPSSSVAYANLAGAYHKARNPVDAIGMYERALNLDGGNFEALTGLVRLRASQNQTGLALDRLNEALGKNSDASPLHHLKAQIYAAEGKHAEAEAELRRVLEADPNDVTAYYSLASLYIAQGQTDRGLAELQKVVERKQESALTFLLIGMAQEKRGEVDRAVESYQKALELNPRQVVAANNLAWLYALEEKGPLFEAARLAQTAVEASPEMPNYLHTSGFVYRKLKMYVQAVTQFRRAVALNPRNPEHRVQLGLALAEMGDRTTARAELREALRARPTGFPQQYEEARKLLSSL